MAQVPHGVAAFGEAIARELASSLGPSLVAAYLHGSAVLGDFDARASDVDLLIILGDDADETRLQSLAQILRNSRDCPGVGLEASAVSATAARRPVAPWPFLVHVTTTPNGHSLVNGHDCAGDEDLILHYAVTRAAGVPLIGPAPESLIGPITRALVLGQLARELRWAVREASEPYAVLNTCRALRYRADGSLIAKTDGARWVLDGLAAPVFVRSALDARLQATTYPVTAAAASWMLRVADELEDEAAE